MGARLTANPSVWTEELALRALYAWVRKHGRVPSANTDWAGAGYGHPSEITIRRLFGSWRRFILVAGLEPRRAGCAPGLSEPGETLFWTRERIAEWMLDRLLATGEWPTVPELRRTSTERRPSYCTVTRQFGSFTNAKRAAGWAAECRQCGKPFSKRARSTQIWCSNVCRRRAESGVLAHSVEPKCAECGTDLDNNVIGCHTCSTRADNRARRFRGAALKNGASVSVVESLPISDSDASQPGRAMAPGRTVVFQPEKAAA